MKSSLHSPNVLCRTCTNWLGRDSAPERRRPPRACSAGYVPAPDLFQCDSYVKLPLTHFVPPPRCRRANVAR